MYDEFGNLITPAEEPPKLNDPRPTSGQKKRNALKSIPNSIETAGNDSEKLSDTASASQRPRRANAGKRKLEDTSDGTTITMDSKRLKIERKKPGRKPRHKTPPLIMIEDTEAAPLSLSSPETEPSSSATEPSNPPAMTQQAYGNLNPSIDIVWHGTMTRLLEDHINDSKEKWQTLHNTISEAEKQWEEVQTSMETIKSFMEKWTSHWTMRNKSTP